jgi:hypothetical protein
MEEIARLSYNPLELKREIERLKREEKSDEKSIATKFKERYRSEKHEFSFVSRINAQESAKAKELSDQRRLLGFGISHDEFTSNLKLADSPIRANQILAARLMEVLRDLDGAGRPMAGAAAPLLDCYRCFDPDSYFASAWTALYALLILYLATYGLFAACFSADSAADGQDCTATGYGLAHAFPPLQWFDAAVDLFFVLDVAARGLLIGVAVERPDGADHPAWYRSERAILEPSRVLRHYALRGGLLFDAASSFPLQWVVMAVEATCAAGSPSLLAARTLRAMRVTRVASRVLRARRVRALIRAAQRRAGNSWAVGLAAVAAAVLLLTHVWACLSWTVQSAGSDDDLARWLEDIGVPPAGHADVGRCYSLVFLSTLQSLLSAEPYRASNSGAAAFGAATACLAVAVSATLLSRILALWEAANRPATEHRERMAAAMEYLRANRVGGALREAVLDYCDFHYAGRLPGFERTFLDELPVDLQVS